MPKAKPRDSGIVPSTDIEKGMVLALILRAAPMSLNLLDALYFEIAEPEWVKRTNRLFDTILDSANEQVSLIQDFAAQHVSFEDYPKRTKKWPLLFSSKELTLNEHLSGMLGNVEQLEQVSPVEGDAATRALDSIHGIFAALSPLVGRILSDGYDDATQRWALFFKPPIQQ